MYIVKVIIQHIDWERPVKVDFASTWQPWAEGYFYSWRKDCEEDLKYFAWKLEFWALGVCIRSAGFNDSLFESDEKNPENKIPPAQSVTERLAATLRKEDN